MSDFLGETIVQAMGAILAAVIIGTFSWIWAGPKRKRKTTMSVEAIEFSFVLKAALRKSLINGVKAGMKEDLLARDVPSWLTGEFIDVVVDRRANTDLWRATHRIEQYNVTNNSDEAAAIEIHNLGSGHVLLDRYGADLEILDAKQQVQYRLPSQGELQMFHFCPVPTKDRVTGVSGLIVVEEHGVPVQVSNRRFFEENISASFYFGNRKFTRIFFFILDVIALVVFGLAIIALSLFSFELIDSFFSPVYEGL